MCSFKPLALNSPAITELNNPKKPQSRAGLPGFLSVELVRSILFRPPTQNVKSSTALLGYAAL